MKRLRSWKQGRREFFKKYRSYRNYIRSSDWQEKREEFLKDSDGTCEWCGLKKGLEVHHKHYMSLGSENRRDVNLICEKCHKDHHEGREIFSDYRIANLSKDENISEIIFSELKKWRLQYSKKFHIRAYYIFNDKTLSDLSIKKPVTDDELVKINGIKEYKLAKYGKEILDIIREYNR